jgi:hypothetical protein
MNRSMISVAERQRMMGLIEDFGRLKGKGMREKKRMDKLEGLMKTTFHILDSNDTFKLTSKELEAVLESFTNPYAPREGRPTVISCGRSLDIHSHM